MDSLKCKGVRRSRFIERYAVFDIEFNEVLPHIETSVKMRPEMLDLGLAFHRNRVELRFENENRNSPEYKGVLDRIYEFCDTNLRGFWTWKKNHRNLDQGGKAYGLDLMFEFEEDLELFLKDHGLIIRLTY